jgi:DNA-binding GntR family transcriptional regulator
LRAVNGTPDARRARSPQLLADRAYAELRDRLVTLRIAPGAPIDEDGLARSLGVGRTPVREAIRRLVLERLVVVYPRRGTFATDINITDLAAIADLRAELEGYAAERAAERLTAAGREQLENLLDELERTLRGGDPESLMQLDARVHRFVYSAAANPYLEETLDRSLNLSMRIWYLALDRVPGLLGTVGEQAALLEAIRDGDAERARALAAEHVRTFERAIRTVL